MIKNWLFHGDFHGRFKDELSRIDIIKYKPEETAIICLGDFGVDYFGDERDDQLKRSLAKIGFTFYVVRGNHEMRPTDVHGVYKVADNNLVEPVYMNPCYQHIRYLIDGYIYTIAGYRMLVIGGAYSVDKYWRLSNMKENGWCGWFENEQLNDSEKLKILIDYAGQHFDFILSHTCPIRYEPTDMFLSFVDQSTVDASTEEWMEVLSHCCKWDAWLFGHFHANRIVAPGVIMLYDMFMSLEEVVDICNLSTIPEEYVDLIGPKYEYLSAEKNLRGDFYNE